MPKLINAQWEEIFTQYLKGIPIPDIAKEHGLNVLTIRTQIRRKGLAKIKGKLLVASREDENKALLDKKAQQIKDGTIGGLVSTLMADSGGTVTKGGVNGESAPQGKGMRGGREGGLIFQQTMQSDVLRSLSIASGLPLGRTRKDLLEHERLMEAINKRGRATFGLDDPTTQNTLVNITVLSGLDPSRNVVDLTAEPSGPAPIEAQVVTERAGSSEESCIGSTPPSGPAPTEGVGDLPSGPAPTRPPL